MTGDPQVDNAVDREYKWARERAEAMQGFYIHLLVYFVVNGGLFLINWATKGADGGWWAIWPLMGWGVGLAIHALTIAVPVFSEDWTERRAQRYLEKRH